MKKSCVQEHIVVLYEVEGEKRTKDPVESNCDKNDISNEKKIHL